MSWKKQIIITLPKPKQSPNPNPQSANKQSLICQPMTLLHLASPSSRMTPQYAYDLLMAEMQLQTTESLSPQIATRLFQLYKIGIQHYNVRQNAPKQRFFKKKLQNLSNHPAVLGMLHNQKNSEQTFYKKKQIQRLVEINNKEATENVGHMLKKMESMENRNKQTIERSIQKQMEEIRRRVERRKIASRPSSTRGDTVDQEEVPQLVPKNTAFRGKVLTSLKGSASFAEHDIKNGETYEKYFVEGYNDDE